MPPFKKKTSKGNCVCTAGEAAHPEPEKESSSGGLADLKDLGNLHVVALGLITSRSTAKSQSMTWFLIHPKKFFTILGKILGPQTPRGGF